MNAERAALIRLDESGVAVAAGYRATSVPGSEVSFADGTMASLRLGRGHALGAVQFGAFSLASRYRPADGQVQRQGPPDLAAGRR
jgi:hypothetical protein